MRATPDDFIPRLIEVLGGLEHLTADRRFAHAASVLTGKRPGRRTIDDAAALRHARALLKGGIAKSDHAAFRMAAKFYAGNSENAVTRRLHRKLKKSRT